MMKEKKEFEEEVLQVDRVTRVVKGGRRLSFRATVVIGNRKGKVAIGLGKANEVSIAIQKGVTQAKKDIVHVPIIRETIPHNVLVKFKATKLLMIPASPGTGLKAGSSTRKILELAGVKNVLSKRFGSGNRINLAKATIKGLKILRQRVKPEDIQERKNRGPRQPMSEKSVLATPAPANGAPATTETTETIESPTNS
jgi:small subunit ribosomal protein S5